MSNDSENLKPKIAPKMPQEKNQDARQATSRPYQTKRQRRAIKSDRVHPSDLARYEVRFFCDDCAHYDLKLASCTMGYLARHTRQEQMAHYNLTGRMAFCRFIEID